IFFLRSIAREVMMTVHWHLGQFRRSAAVRIVLLTAVCWLCAPPAVRAQGSGVPPTLPPELEQVRTALDKYQDPFVAVHDGYFSTVGCVESPSAGGAGQVPSPVGAWVSAF